VVYKANGVEYESSVRLLSIPYHLSPGQKVNVFYNPKEPSNHYIEESVKKSSLGEKIFIAALGCFYVIFILISAFSNMEPARIFFILLSIPGTAVLGAGVTAYVERKMFKHGCSRSTPGTILEELSFDDSSGIHHCYPKVGYTVKGVEYAFISDEYTESLPETLTQGKIVHVQFNPENPEQHYLLEDKLRFDIFFKIFFGVIWCIFLMIFINLNLHK
jgi:hypothetical protein